VRVRGHTPRILGQVLIAIGAILVVLGAVAAAIGLLWVKDSSTASRPPPDGTRQVVQALVMGGIVATLAGVLALVAGVVLRGVGKALHERAGRLDATPPAT
jgi:ABC-type Fe3+ transport system permease subunit